MPRRRPFSDRDHVIKDGELEWSGMGTAVLPEAGPLAQFPRVGTWLPIRVLALPARVWFIELMRKLEVRAEVVGLRHV